LSGLTQKSIKLKNRIDGALNDVAAPLNNNAWKKVLEAAIDE
jgi:hypothetical protein